MTVNHTLQKDKNAVLLSKFASFHSFTRCFFLFVLFFFPLLIALSLSRNSLFHHDTQRIPILHTFGEHLSVPPMVLFESLVKELKWSYDARKQSKSIWYLIVVLTFTFVCENIQIYSTIEKIKKRFLAWAWLAKAKGHSCHTKISTLAKTLTEKNE